MIMGKIIIGLPTYVQRYRDLQERPTRWVEIEIPAYAPEYGVWPVSEDDYLLDVQIEAEEKSVVITADRGGLLSLARHLLTLAQDEVPLGSHIHYDGDMLEEGSCKLIIGRM